MKLALLTADQHAATTPRRLLAHRLRRMDAGRAAGAHPAPGAAPVRAASWARSSRATTFDPAVRRTGRVPRAERAGDGVHRRPARVPRPQRLAARPRPASRRRRSRARPAPGIDPCAALQCVLELEPGESATSPMLLGAAGRGGEAARAGGASTASVEGGAARRSTPASPLGASGSSVITVRTPEPTLRRDDQPLDAVPGARLPDVGALGALPEQRRLRLPRPAAGRDGARLRRAGAGAGAHPARGGAPVRRGRRAALVAPAERPRRAHPVLRRPRLAARTWSTTTCASPATPRCWTRTSRSSPCAPLAAGRARGVRSARGHRASAAACTSTACARCARPAPRARTACR